MKLAFCLFNYFPFGGLQRDFLRIAKECVHRGHSVDVFVMKWEGEKPPEFTIHLIQPKGWQNHTRIHSFISNLQAHLAVNRYDRVIGFNKMPGLDVYYAADTCFQAKARQKHGAWYRWSPRYRLYEKYERTVFSAQSKTDILLIAKSQQPEFIKWYHTNESRFHVLPPGIARDRVAPLNAEFIRAAMRQSLALLDNELMLLMVGSGFKTKGLDRIIEGVAALPDHLKKRARLYVVGQDNARLFQKQAVECGMSDRVIFLGGRHDVPQLLLAADLLVHPAYHENTGTVLLEAIVSGLPVLTTDVCGYAEYVQLADAGRVLSSPFQQSEFNALLAEMLVSKDRPSWHENGLAFAKQADIYSMPERAVDVIEGLKK